MGGTSVLCAGCQQVHMAVRVDGSSMYIRCDACEARAQGSVEEKLYLLVERDFLEAYCDPDTLDWIGKYPECWSTSSCLEWLCGGVFSEDWLDAAASRLELTYHCSEWAEVGCTDWGSDEDEEYV
jgi:hypothetical protein